MEGVGDEVLVFQNNFHKYTYNYDFEIPRGVI